MQKIKTRSCLNISIGFGLALSLALSSNAFAGSFQSLEQSAARLGQANAGTTTDTSDASIEYYNPAGMTLIKRPSISISGIEVMVNIAFHPELATNYRGQPITGDNKGPGTNNLLPALHYVQPLTNKLAFGFGITTPYGLETTYPDNSFARYFATESSIKTFNFSPSLAYQLTDKFSIGAGFDAQLMRAELDQQFDAQTFAAQKGFYYPGDVLIKNKGHDWAYGWNLGILYKFSPCTRAGIAYRSQMKHDFTGDTTAHNIDFNNPLAPMFLQLINGKVTSTITLPQNATLSVQHDINHQWTLLGDLQYTNWSKLNSLTMTFPGNGRLPPSVTKLNYHDSWRLSVGQSYKFNDKLTLRNGFAFDGTPVDKVYRTARIPDANRYWITFGANYKFTPKISGDLGYGLILFEHSHIHQVNPAIPYSILNARYTGVANLVGAQLNFRF